MNIRPATDADIDAIWRIIAPTIRAGATYTLDPAMSKEDALRYWMGPDKETFVAENGNSFVGTYYLRANKAGGGAHGLGRLLGAGRIVRQQRRGDTALRVEQRPGRDPVRGLGDRLFKILAQLLFTMSQSSRSVRIHGRPQ